MNKNSPNDSEKNSISRELAEKFSINVQADYNGYEESLWIGDDEWSPTTDLNQIFKYLLPKLKENEFVEIEMGFYGPWFGIEIKRRHNITDRIIQGDHHDMLSFLEIKDPDKIPETICLAILDAMEKIK